jgi:beta-lactamase class A
MTPEKALERLFSAEKASAAWFSEAFLAQVPLEKIDAISGQVRAASGAFKGVRPSGRDFVVDFERGAWAATVKLDDAGRFAGLLIRPESAAAATVDEAMAAFRALPGKVSVLVTSDDVVRGAIEPDQALGVGSTFKLAILAALRAEVDQKKRSWKDVVELRADHGSLPSGFLQTWPDHAPVTLYTLAALMISISDNTATDTLLRLVGRGPVEALASRNKPFMMTREMFQMKASDGSEVLAAFRKGDEAGRRKVLEGLVGRPLPKAETYPDEPTALDVEWFFTARELCGLMKRVHDLPLMSINPGVAKKGDWDAVAYKGGSEPGVLSMTTWLEKGGRSHCVSATWNAPQKLAEAEFSVAYAKAITALKK